ncbi:MAG TPA: acetyl-CoA carboxylase biotin carboxyl carrier protein [Bryobacteraceae bacterium]|nr:acetyl-CoA carboxylase biotin carboxyl carrier protein [Bryobacteraceae bacterium]
MTLDEIKELIEVVQQSGVAELEVQRGENRVRIRRSAAPAPPEIVIAPAAAPVVTAAAPPMSPSVLPVNSATAPTTPAAAAQPEPENEADLTFVKSPIVGTYYDAASPGAPPFVKAGDHVSPGQVLCIIESMKLMNEIESELSGIVVRKLVENGKPVEYGQALFAIRPA